MTHYLISFDDGAMDHIADGDLPAVGAAAHAVMRDAMEAGAWVYGGGLMRQPRAIVGTDGSITDGPTPETKTVVGGFCVVDVATRDEALMWAAKTAVACRCAQEVREIMDDPERDAYA